MEHHYDSMSEQDTAHIGRILAEHMAEGGIIALSGNLGAGKTTLTKSIASTIGVTTDITSPTFTIMNVYPCVSSVTPIQTFVHIDTYRLHDEQELLDIGVEEYLEKPHTLTVIEWPEKLHTLLKRKKVMHVTIQNPSVHQRSIDVSFVNT